jgi:hypothetical protein
MTCSRTRLSRDGRRLTGRRLRELAAFFPDCIVLTRRLLGRSPLRYVLKLAGPQVVQDHWPGSPAGLAVVTRLAG